MKRKKILLATMLTLACLLAGALGARAMSSPSYKLSWDALSDGGGGRSSASYRLGDTAGQSSAIGPSQSANYRLGAGYWYGVPVMEEATTVQISVTLQGSSRPDPVGWQIPVTVDFYQPGTSNLKYTFSGATAKSGSAATVQVPDILPGNYDITIDGETTLTNIKKNVAIAAGTNSVNMGTLLEGDANGDGIIDMLDFTLLAASFMKMEGDVGFNSLTDFDRNGIVDMLDFTLLAGNFMKMSPVEVP